MALSFDALSMHQLFCTYNYKQIEIKNIKFYFVKNLDDENLYQFLHRL